MDIIKFRHLVGTGLGAEHVAARLSLCSLGLDEIRSELETENSYSAAEELNYREAMAYEAVYSGRDPSLHR